MLGIDGYYKSVQAKQTMESKQEYAGYDDEGEGE
jgi:hypothetical protein